MSDLKVWITTGLNDGATPKVKPIFDNIAKSADRSAKKASSAFDKMSAKATTVAIKAK